MPTDDEPSPGASSAPPTMPRWVKVFAIIGAVVLTLVVVVLVVAPEGHGPGRHLTSGDASPSAMATSSPVHASSTTSLPPNPDPGGPDAS